MRGIRDVSRGYIYPGNPDGGKDVRRMEFRKGADESGSAADESPFYSDGCHCCDCMYAGSEAGGKLERENAGAQANDGAPGVSGKFLSSDTLCVKFVERHI